MPIGRIAVEPELQYTHAGECILAAQSINFRRNEAQILRDQWQLWMLFALALLTGVFVSPDLGGPGFVTDWVKGTSGFTSIGEQLVIQAKAVGIAVVWSGVVAAVSLFIVKMVVGLRVPEDEEREGLDITSHGETAYS